MDLLAEALQPPRQSEDDVHVADQGACPEPDVVTASEDHRSTSQAD